MLKVLYLGMYWDYGDPSRGRSFEEMAFHAALRAHPDVEVTHFDYVAEGQQHGLDEMNRRLRAIGTEGDFDCLFCVLFHHEVRAETLTAISASGTATIGWGCDDHWRFDAFSREQAAQYDWWCTTARSAKQRFDELGYTNVIKSQWAIEPTIYHPLPVPRDIDISFVGQPHGIRPQVIQWLYESGVQVQLAGFGWAGYESRLSHEQMVETFSRSKLNLNLSNASVMGEQQIKGRVFEVPGCGGVLLTDPADDLESYFEPGREVVVYDSPEDLLEKIHHYLTNDEEREAIAAAALERTLREHTWRHRFDAIFGTAGLT